jgi:tetratricopeptide (TPR) repeat protein
MATNTKGKGSSDRVALAVFALALITFVILSYGFLSRMKGHGSYSPVRSTSQFLSDLERHVKGYLGEIERAFAPHKSRKREAKKHIFAGYTKYKEKKFDKALGEFDSAIKVDPKNAEAYFWRGRAFIRVNRYEDATADFEMAVKLNPAYVDAYNNLGWLYGRAGKYRESITCLTKAIELKPENGWAYYYRGRIHQEIGEARMAMGDAKEACRLGLQDGCTMYERLKEEFL